MILSYEKINNQSNSYNKYSLVLESTNLYIICSQTKLWEEWEAVA